MSTTEHQARGLEIADTVVRAMRTGEHAAAIQVASALGPGVELTSTMGDAKGRDDVVHRLSGQWAFTPVLARGVWERPVWRDGVVEVHGAFPLLGAAPRHLVMTLDFDTGGLVSRIEQAWEMPAPADEVHELPSHVASSINRALAMNTPIVLGYVHDGAPKLSLRGSVQVSGPMELSLWVRKATGGLVDAIADDANVSLLYRDSPSRTTYTIVGRARLATDGRTRDAVYNRSPEVEQLHDPNRTGAAVIVDVDRLQGTSPFGAVVVTRT